MVRQTTAVNDIEGGSLLTLALLLHYAIYPLLWLESDLYAVLALEQILGDRLLFYVIDIAEILISFIEVY